MKTFRAFMASVALFAPLSSTAAQTDTTRRDSTSVQGAIYRRPFIGSAGSASIGGYMEANANYLVTDGATDGFSSEMRRFNIFLFAPVGARLRFTSELEFEHGTEEIALETALLDYQITSALVFRGGILLVPIGGFNQNHDGPRWEFVQRPLSATEIVPSTLSEVGFGANGRFFLGKSTLTYDAYLTNGLNDGIILNQSGKTRLAEGKGGEQLEEDNNGSPAFSARVALQHGKFGEVGVSHYNGVYNTHKIEGEAVDLPRKVSITAIDLSTRLWQVDVRGEIAMNQVQLPPSLQELQASKQWGSFLDMVVPVFRPKLRSHKGAVINAALRLEFVDLNSGKFASTGARIFDETRAISAGLSFRPVSGTVFRANYVRQQYRDVFGNAAVNTGGFRVGLATYF
ncbi:MAG: hypothetical protein ABI852_12920 [Gemmatimonadaceae bacterium]